MRGYSKVVLSSFAKVGTTSLAKSLGRGRAYEHTQSIIRIKEMVDGGGMLFLCGVRDFVSRNVSYFFQIMTEPSYNNVQCSSNNFKGERCYLGGSKDVLAMSTDDLMGVFWSEINHATPLLWFRDFFKLIGFDIDKEKFPNDVGHCSYELSGNNGLILYRLDSIEAMVGANREMFRGLYRKNISRNKWYADKYADFRDKIRFDGAYLDEQLDNEIMRFFYTEKDINGFIKKYEKR